jgi:acyl carrier protein phosphodiesterase
MNYLAHSVIGGGAARPDVLVGNFIGDAVKGSAWRAYPAGVQEGILLHRAIDAFVDAHPESVASRRVLRPAMGRMAGVALDLLHDHFLAGEFADHVEHAGGLSGFAREVEAVWVERAAEMPERSQRFLRGLVAHRWLEGYADREELRAICTAMDARIPWPTRLVDVVEVSGGLEEELRGRFREMFREVRGALGG